MNNKGFIEILSILIICLVFGLIGYMIYEDVSYGTKQGIVIDKRYNSQWVSYSTSNVNGVRISVPVVHPETWSIKIKKGNQAIWIDVTKDEYENINIGDCYQCNKNELLEKAVD